MSPKRHLPRRGKTPQKPLFQFLWRFAALRQAAFEMPLDSRLRGNDVVGCCAK